MSRHSSRHALYNQALQVMGFQSFEEFAHHVEALCAGELVVKSNIDKKDTEIQATDGKLQRLKAKRDGYQERLDAIVAEQRRLMAIAESRKDESAESLSTTTSTSDTSTASNGSMLPRLDQEAAHPADSQLTIGRSQIPSGITPTCSPNTPLAGLEEAIIDSASRAQRKSEIVTPSSRPRRAAALAGRRTLLKIEKEYPFTNEGRRTTRTPK